MRFVFEWREFKNARRSERGQSRFGRCQGSGRSMLEAYLDLALAEELIRIERDNLTFLKLLSDPASDRAEAGEYRLERGPDRHPFEFDSANDRGQDRAFQRCDL
jgi:hypothetical protein